MAALLTLLLAGGAATCATDKTEVGVVFELTDQHYLDEFKDEQIPVLLAAAAAAVAEALNQKIRFLSFTANGNALYRLTIKLDRAEGSPAELPAEFGFHVSLDGPDVRDDAKTYIKFRDMDRYSDLFLNVDDLVDAVALRIVETDHGPLIERVLKYVAIAEGGEFIQQPAGWIIATDPAEFCLDVDTRLKIKNKFPPDSIVSRYAFEATVRESEVPGRLLSLLDPTVDPPMVQQLSATSPADLQVEEVYVLVYRRYCAQPVAPDQVDFSQ